MDAQRRRHRPALLLSQLGDYASARFAEQVARVGLRPAEAATLRLIGRSDHLNQRQLAARIGTPPSRVVALLDGLESRGLVQRQRDAKDRRNSKLSLTAEGELTLKSLTEIVRAHEEHLFGSLRPDEFAALTDTLARLAHIHDLDTEVHRGVGRLRGAGSADPGGT